MHWFEGKHRGLPEQNSSHPHTALVVGTIPRGGLVSYQRGAEEGATESACPPIPFFL
jgi:hypothetical protein